MERKKMMNEMRGAWLAPETREGERSEPERGGGANHASGGAVAPLMPTPDPEVSDKAVRRIYSAQYKLKILGESDRCNEPGGVGALLRREGLYSSLLSYWRKQREVGQLDGLTGKKRGRNTTSKDKIAAENKQLRRETQRLAHKLRQAELVIDIQKKASELLGIPLNSLEHDENAS